MAKNYVIAIGGTGERVMRAITHLCDCGHISVDEIKLLIIDPDKNNGTKNELEKMLNLYGECHDNFSDENFQLFKTKISKVLHGGDNTGAEWSISPVANMPGRGADTNQSFHLNDYITKEKNQVAEHFMKAVYSEDEYSVKDLDEGFFAHPSLGAAMFAYWLEQSDKFASFLADLNTDLIGGEVRVFIIGSSFGGTGASGFPAVARKIKNGTKDNAGNPNPKLIIAGEFFLPYFTFGLRDENGVKIDGNNIIDYNEFLKAGRNAAAFYNDNNSVDAFNRVYVLGAPDVGNVKIVRNFYADRGEKQENWPHMLELIGALAAKDFFDTPSANLNGNGTPWFGVGVNVGDFYDIEWKHLPNSVSETEDNEAKKRGIWGARKNSKAIQTLEGNFNKFLIMSSVYIPAFLSKFYDKSNDGYQIKLYKDCGKFKPIISHKAFCDKKNKIWKVDFLANVEKLTILNDYFHEHAIWFSRLISDYIHPNDGNEDLYKRILFRKLIKGSELLTKRALNSWNSELPPEIPRMITASDNGYSTNTVVDAIGSDLYGEVKASEDVKKMIKQLVQGIYKITQKCV